MNQCGIKTATAQECQELCNNEADCVEFTWIGIALGGNEDSKNKCCLKNAAFDKKESAPGLVSGPKNCEHDHDHVLQRNNPNNLYKTLNIDFD